MSEPITIYCTTAHEWAARSYQPGDAMTLVSPSFVREMMTSGQWSLDAPTPVVAQTVKAAATPMVVPPVAPRRRGKSKQ